MKNPLKTKIGIYFAFLFVIMNSIDSFAVSLKTLCADITINEKGFYSSVKVNGEEVLYADNCPFITACVTGRLIMPELMRAEGEYLILKMTDGESVKLRQFQYNTHITLEVIEIPDCYEALLFGPLKINIDETVGDVIGVAQGRGIAFGVQSLNMKTCAGIPLEYVDEVEKTFGYSGNDVELSVGSIPCYRLAAVPVRETGGTMFQFSVRRRTQVEYRHIQQTEQAIVYPVDNDDAFIQRSKIALFGCRSADVLQYIGKIEEAEGLPHPLFNGEWGKISRDVTYPYLISNFSENDIDFVLDKAKIAGFKYIYHPEPFKSWGHFDWSLEFTKKGDEGVRKMVDKARNDGIAMGIHTLSNFMTTNDAYVTPVPSGHLLKQGVLRLISDVDDKQNEIKIEKSSLFAMPMNLNVLQIDDELITYGQYEEKEAWGVLKQCRRGVFGTRPASHFSNVSLYKLWDYPYKTLFPDLKLQDRFSDRLAEIFNKTGLKQISFDGLEGCTYTGQDDYAVARFVTRFYDSLTHCDVINDASNLNHFLWHIHTRMNWGEPWGEEMRTGQVENRIKNQMFFSRNFLPQMLGWFLIRLADRKFECTSVQDLEWALSKAAGFDAGYAMNISLKTLKEHGQIDKLLTTIKYWNLLRRNRVFSEEQKNRLRDVQSEWHLEKLDECTYSLYPLDISKKYYCNLSEMQPGQPGGADWLWNNKYGVGTFAFKLRVEGEGTISNPVIITPGGTLKFPCRISGNQYLIFDFDGTAVVTDRNLKTICNVCPQGQAIFPEGSFAVSFSCKLESEERPEIMIRYITRGIPEFIELRTTP